MSVCEIFRRTDSQRQKFVNLKFGCTPVVHPEKSKYIQVRKENAKTNMATHEANRFSHMMKNAY